MLIDEIIPINKERSTVKLDSGEHFVLYKGELRILKLKEGSELSEECYDRIMTVVLPKRAKLRAMNLLKSRPYTEYNLKKKLEDGGYPETVIQEALEYVKSYGYVNDKAYAIDFIKCQTEAHSKKEIYLKLSQKGIQKEILDAAFNETYGAYQEDRFETSFDETGVIIKALKKKGYTGTESYEERQKILAYFYRRGFDMDKVYRAMDEVKNED